MSILKNVEAADEVILALVEILDNAVVNGRYRERAVKAVEAATGLKAIGNPLRVCPWYRHESNVCLSLCRDERQ
jgi:hypothetical protein